MFSFNTVIPAIDNLIFAKVVSFYFSKIKLVSTNALLK